MSEHHSNSTTRDACPRHDVDLVHGEGNEAPRALRGPWLRRPKIEAGPLSAKGMALRHHCPVGHHLVPLGLVGENAPGQGTLRSHHPPKEPRRTELGHRRRKGFRDKLHGHGWLQEGLLLWRCAGQDRITRCGGQGRITRWTRRRCGGQGRITRGSPMGTSMAVSPISASARCPMDTSMAVSTGYAVTQYCFRAGNRASGPDFGRILVGKASKSALRPAFGRNPALLERFSY